MKDWFLSLGTAVMVGIILSILLIGFIVPHLRADPMLIDDIEQKGGINVSR